MEYIYLLSSDGHRDSLELDYFASTEEELFKLLKYNIMEMFDKEIEEIIFNDEEKRIIHFSYIDFDGEIEKSEFKYIKIKKIK